MIMHNNLSGYCHFPFDKVKINSAGDVTNCCWMNEPIGNILNQTLEEIWNSNLLLQIRQSVINRLLHANCRGLCPHNFQPLIQKSISQLVYPRLLELDLPNTHCNIGGHNPTPDTACIMCSRAMPNFSPSSDLSDEVAKAYSKYTRHLQSVHIQGIAEPFWKGRIFRILELLLAPDTLHVSAITNGTLLSGDNLTRWLHIPNSRLIISIDAGTPATYKKIRKIAAFDTILNNIDQFNKLKSTNQYLQLTANINIHNVHEVEQIVEIAAKYNVNSLELNTTDIVDDAMSHMVVNANNAHLFHQAQERATILASQLGVRLVILKPLSLNYI